MTADEARAIAADMPAGSGLRAALLATARRLDEGDRSPVTIPILKE